MVEGYFPKSLKLAEIVPFFKSGDMQGPSKYRAVSFLISLSKNVERIMYTKLENFGNIKTRKSETVWISKKNIHSRRSNLSNGEYKKPTQ